MAEESNPSLNKLIENDSDSSLSQDEPSKEEISAPGQSKEVKFSDSIRQYPNDELKIFETDSVIGFGSFGKVRKYHHKNQTVAIKEFSITGDDETISNIWNMVQREANILCRFHHENIVKIQGITQWPKAIGIIMEYVDGGNLQTLLSKDHQSDLLWKTRLDIASGITSGLNYIHNYDETNTFCHGDLKPANVLLTQSLQVKLADFGSAALHRATSTSTTTISHVSTTQFTLIYVAPEFLEDNTRKRNPAMDMYSFGMVLYELISRKTPYSDSAMPMHVPALIMTKVKPSMKLIDNAASQLETDNDRAVFSFLKKLMQSCWKNVSVLRPSSKSVRMELSSFLNNQIQGFSPRIYDSQKTDTEATSFEREYASARKTTKQNLKSSTSRAFGRPSWFGQGESVLINKQESIQVLLAKYKDSLLNLNYEEADRFRAALRSLIVDDIHVEANKVLILARKVKNEKKYLHSVAISDTAAAMYAKLKNPEDDLQRMHLCIQEMKSANKKMIIDDVNMKEIVRDHVIPIMRKWLSEMKCVKQVSEKWRCYAVSWVLYDIGLSEKRVDQWEESKQTLEEAVNEMRRVYGHDVHRLHGRFFGRMLNELGENYKRNLRFKEAAAFFEETIKAHRVGLDYFGNEENRKCHIEIAETNLKSISGEI